MPVPTTNMRAAPSVAQDGDLQDRELAAEFSGMLCDLGGAISTIAQNEAATQRQDRGGRKREDWSQAIGHIDVMLSSEASEVQCSGSRALATLAETSSEAKERICSSSGIIRKLVKVMSGGGLDAIADAEVIELACKDQYAMAAWQCIHLTRDVLQADYHCALSSDFAARVRHSIAQEE